MCVKKVLIIGICLAYYIILYTFAVVLEEIYCLYGENNRQIHCA